jgi:hypothetical protein
MTREVYATPTTAEIAIMIRIIRTWVGIIVMRNKKRPTAILRTEVEMV